MTLLPAARWTPDCQGKWDYDGPLLDISCRYYPASYSRNGQCSAIASILFNHEPGEYTAWREREFYGRTEQEVKRKVETWVDQQFRQIHALLTGESRWRMWFNRLRRR